MPPKKSNSTKKATKKNAKKPSKIVDTKKSKDDIDELETFDDLDDLDDLDDINEIDDINDDEDDDDDDEEEEDDEEDENDGNDIDNINDDDDGDNQDNCAYDKVAKKRSMKDTVIDGHLYDDMEEEDDDDVEDEIIIDNKFVENNKRRTKPYLTKYEKTRILGDRVSQLTQGAKPMIKNVSKMNPNLVAQLELESQVIPIKIIRTMPDGTKELWGIDELKIKKEFIKYGYDGENLDIRKINRVQSMIQKGGNIRGLTDITK
jgi:DNA-directed RNA polymerase subunit K/omega